MRVWKCGIWKALSCENAQPETVSMHEHLSCQWQSELGHWMNFFHPSYTLPLKLSLPEFSGARMVIS